MKNTRIFELLLPCRREKINTTSEFADGDKKGPERRVAKSGARRTHLRTLLTPPMNGKLVFLFNIHGTARYHFIFKNVPPASLPNIQ